MKCEGLLKDIERSPEQGVHVAKEVQGNKEIVGGVSAKGGHTDGEEGDVIEGDEAGNDQFKRVVILLGCNSSADGCKDLDVALPDNGQGYGQHPLDVERDKEEEDREDPVLYTYDQDVKLGHMVPSEPAPEVFIIPPCSRQLEMGDNYNGDDPCPSANDPHQRYWLRQAQKWSPHYGGEGPVKKVE